LHQVQSRSGMDSRESAVGGVGLGVGVDMTQLWLTLFANVNGGTDPKVRTSQGQNRLYARECGTF
jgi:hypothetical protein